MTRLLGRPLWQPREMTAARSSIYDISMGADGELTTEAGLVVERSYGPDDLDGDLERIGEPRRVPVHARQPPRRLPRQALDLPAVLGLRHRRVVERALPAPAPEGWYRALGGRRSPDPDRLRLRRPRRRGGGRPRSGSRSTRSPTPRSSSATSRSTRSRRRGRSTAPPRSCSRSTSRSAASRGSRAAAARHGPERHPQGVRVARHLDLAAHAVDPADRRLDRVLRRRGAALQRGVGRRRALPRRGRQRRAGDGVHPAGRGHLLRRDRRSRSADDRPIRAAGVVLLLHPQRLLRGGREVPGRSAALGAHRARSLRRARRRARRCSAPASCAAVGRCRRSSRTTTSCGSPTRRWRRCSAACSRCSPPRGTSRSRCPPRRAPRSRSARSRSSPTRPA